MADLDAFKAKADVVVVGVFATEAEKAAFDQAATRSEVLCVRGLIFLIQHPNGCISANVTRKTSCTFSRIQHINFSEDVIHEFATFHELPKAKRRFVFRCPKAFAES